MRGSNCSSSCAKVVSNIASPTLDVSSSTATVVLDAIGMDAGELDGASYVQMVNTAGLKPTLL